MDTVTDSLLGASSNQALGHVLLLTIFEFKSEGYKVVVRELTLLIRIIQKYKSESNLFCRI
jgi:hypothetical protein